MTGQELAFVLRQRGHRLTRARQATWDALQSAKGHPTVEELAVAVGRLVPGTNLASVYRALALFEDLGLARATRLGEDAGRWELAHPDDAFHLVCRECGSVDHHAGEIVERMRTHLRDGHGFRSDTIELTVTGTCANCS